MAPQPITSPEDQSVTFVELFFDLVFVFSVTQVVGLLHNGLTWPLVGQAVLVFWLVWWGWTQFTWALNAADTTHSLVQLGVLVATAVAFFMAVALPGAFADRGLAFAISYVLTRGIGLYIYIWVAGADQEQGAAVRTFALVSVGGLAAVITGGLLGGEAQFALWGMAILLDVIAANVGGARDGWNLHPEHFSERHGLFVIIALGETLIVAASGVTASEWSISLAAVATLSVAITCSLWWSYFPRAKPALDEAFTQSGGATRAPMGRDIFSLLHFPMLCGVIAYAVAIQESVAHPGYPLSVEIRISLAAGIFLFVGGMISALLRAGLRMPVVRLFLTIVTAASIIAVTNVPPLVTLLIALAGLLLIVLAEHRTADPYAARN